MALAKLRSGGEASGEGGGGEGGSEGGGGEGESSLNRLAGGGGEASGAVEPPVTMAQHTVGTSDTAAKWSSDTATGNPDTAQPTTGTLVGHEASPAPDGGVNGGVNGGVKGGVERGMNGGAEGGAEGGVQGGVEGGVQGGVQGGFGTAGFPPPPASRASRSSAVRAAAGAVVVVGGTVADILAAPAAGKALLPGTSTPGRLSITCETRDPPTSKQTLTLDMH